MARGAILAVLGGHGPLANLIAIRGCALLPRVGWRISAVGLWWLVPEEAHNGAVAGAKGVLVSHLTRVSAEEAWESAYKESATLEAWDQAAYLLEQIGSRVTAASLGIRDARTIRRWRDERLEPRDAAERQRLRLLYRIVRAVMGVYTKPSVAVGFLTSANPQLDDQAPMLLLADGHADQDQRPILASLRAFLEG